jgi:hypothetical protein
MRTPRIFGILVLILSAISIAGAQAPGKASLRATTPVTHTRVVHIVAPASDQNLKASTVSIRYEVSSTKHSHVRPDLFRVQLDSETPVETNETAYTFDQVTPGQHAVSVELLDAKHRPIVASKAEMSFVMESPDPNPVPEVAVGPMMPATLQKVAVFLPQVAAPIDPSDGSGEMPLLSVIGLGVLIGGMVSAMKTRT